MKIFKSKIFWLIAAIVVIAAIIFGVRSESKIEYTTQAAEIRDIVQTVSATGQVKSASEIELNFKNTGRLSVLNVDTGTTVSAGQIVAQLRGSALQIDVNRARANLQEAQANFDKVVAGATLEDIAVSQAALAKAQTDLEDAEVKLTNAEKTYSQALDNERTDVLVDINSALTKANISLQEIDDTLNYEGDDDNFKTTNTALENQAADDLATVSDTVNDAEAVYNTAKLDLQDDEIDTATTASLTALLDVETLLEDLSQLLDDVIITSVLTQSELDTLRDNNNTERTTIDTSINTLQSAKQDLNDARLTNQVKTEEAQNAVSVAEKNLSKAQADLTLKRAAARPEDVALQQAKVSQARASLQLAQDKLNETILRAPITGIVIEVNYEVGEQTSLTTPAVKMLAAEKLEIEVDIPESDIAKVAVGDESIITLDAFTDEDEFLGSVTTVNPAQTEIQDVIYYKVTVSFAVDQPAVIQEKIEGVKPGMTTNIEIETDRMPGVLVVPSRAVKEQDGQKFVEVLTGSEVTRLPVTTGLRGDEGLIEITSGLNAGQEVITFVKEK